MLRRFRNLLEFSRTFLEISRKFLEISTKFLDISMKFLETFLLFFSFCFPGSTDLGGVGRPNVQILPGHDFAQALAGARKTAGRANLV